MTDRQEQGEFPECKMSYIPPNKKLQLIIEVCVTRLSGEENEAGPPPIVWMELVGEQNNQRHVHLLQRELIRVTT